MTPSRGGSRSRGCPGPVDGLAYPAASFAREGQLRRVSSSASLPTVRSRPTGLPPGSRFDRTRRNLASGSPLPRLPRLSLFLQKIRTSRPSPVFAVMPAFMLSLLASWMTHRFPTSVRKPHNTHKAPVNPQRAPGEPPLLGVRTPPVLLSGPRRFRQAPVQSHSRYQ